MHSRAIHRGRTKWRIALAGLLCSATTACADRNLVTGPAPSRPALAEAPFGSDAGSCYVANGGTLFTPGGGVAFISICPYVYPGGYKAATLSSDYLVEELAWDGNWYVTGYGRIYGNGAVWVRPRSSSSTAVRVRVAPVRPVVDADLRLIHVDNYPDNDSDYTIITGEGFFDIYPEMTIQDWVIEELRNAVRSKIAKPSPFKVRNRAAAIGVRG